MLKIKAGQELIKAVNKSYTEGSLSVPEAMLYCSQAANKLVREYIYSLRQEGENDIPFEMLREYTDTVTKDAIKDEWFVELPVRTLQVNTFQQGVYHVFPESDESELIIPTMPGFKGMFKGTAAEGMQGRMSYRPIGKRLYLTGENLTSDYKVTMRLIPDCEDLAPDEELILPPDFEMNMLDLALNLVKVKLAFQQDTQIDGTNT